MKAQFTKNQLYDLDAALAKAAEDCRYQADYEKGEDAACLKAEARRYEKMRDAAAFREIRPVRIDLEKSGLKFKPEAISK